jgi:hypothetical protein
VPSSRLSSHSAAGRESLKAYASQFGIPEGAVPAYFSERHGRRFEDRHGLTQGKTTASTMRSEASFRAYRQERGAVRSLPTRR